MFLCRRNDFVSFLLFILSNTFLKLLFPLAVQCGLHFLNLVCFHFFSFQISHHKMLEPPFRVLVRFFFCTSMFVLVHYVPGFTNPTLFFSTQTAGNLSLLLNTKLALTFICLSKIKSNIFQGIMILASLYVM